MTLLTMLGGSSGTTRRFATLEYYDGVAWRDISSDLLSGSLSWSGGIRGSGPTDRIAIPGQMSFDLKNGQNASGGLGYYSPNHASKRAGWAVGVMVRISITSGTIDPRYWVYRIREITPVAGLYGERRVEVTAKDYMQEFSDRKVSGLAVQTDQRGDQLLTTLVATMPFAPTTTSYGTGAFYFPYAFHDEKDEETAVLTVLQKISQSEMSYIYVDGSATGGEKLIYEPHTTRQGIVSPSATFSDTMSDLQVTHSRESVYNKVRAVVYPVEVDSDISVLGSITEEFSLEPGEVRTIHIRYVHEVSTRRISGIGIVTLEADTDYKMSSLSGNGGNNFNANLTTTPVTGGNTLEVTVENTAAVKGYVNHLQVRGYKVTLFDKLESVASDATSISTYGERAITYNMPYQNSTVFGESLANEILRRYKDPVTDVSGMDFFANRSTTFMSYALTLGIGSRVTIAETVTGINSDYFINGFDYELKKGGVLQVNWILERSFNTTRYFTVGDATYGVIGGAYSIAPF
jgi:hypothetical protein